MSNSALILSKAGEKQVVKSRSRPTPAAHEILVRVHAVATNPVDNLMAKHGYNVKSFPLVLGSDVSGLVEDVGSSVTSFSKGDRVAGFSTVLATSNPDHGAFQEYSILYEHAAVKLPSNISFEQGAVLPMAVATAGQSMFVRQKISKSQSAKDSIYFVWGGSSSTGTAAIQLARYFGFTVFATASPHHHEYLKSLGAAQVFNYKDASIEEEILDAANSLDKPILHGFCAVTGDGANTRSASILSTSAKRAGKTAQLSVTLPWPEESSKPSNVEITMPFAALLFTEKDEEEVATWLFNKTLAQLLADGDYRPSPAIQIVEGGLEGIEKALELHAAGISGKKLVIPLV
ncbi:protein of unknown function [Taphrina deformans PYCC 5710]|uniref:Enoyl reductase (ER) domain-containing protein n=1 Tax=Taphrina deformans (strain PYCC 5710 / ATCC 11124 / CBS 356.35 / IMI 108563 / JCM 9778 / NBRC 8474) TaxID=1097556 RepID=R4XGY9_TAPDE|nr:protein of unknown function [Taphrina deformans PYCC 5710]|eukprot:CCG85061.1 protein of unknown function [Taphrina deformans PYCC 5710]